MRTPEVDYRNLRFYNLTTPEYRHLFLLLGWAGYFALYYVTEKWISTEICYPVHCWLDDRIPFCEWFIIPYVSWYLLILGSIVYFLLYSVDGFQKLQKYFIFVQVVATIVYIVFPNRQDLRPDVFTRENVLTRLVSMIYAVDTNTGVCPSLHVACSLGIVSTWLREKNTGKWQKCLIGIWCFLICISVAFVKQHSVVDIFAGFLVAGMAEWFLYYRK